MTAPTPTLSDGPTLEEIEQRLKAATPGPWAYEPHGDTGDYGVGVLVDENDEPVTGYQEPGVHTVAEPVAPEVSHQADAALIAHAPTDIAALIAMVRSAREEERERCAMQIEQHAVLNVAGWVVRDALAAAIRAGG